MAYSAPGGANNWLASPMFSYNATVARAPWIVGVSVVTNALVLVILGGVNVLVGFVPDALPSWDSSSFLYIFVIARRESGMLIIGAVAAVYGVFAVLFGFWVARRLALSRQAIAVTADGVFAFSRGAPSRSIGWREVTSITRRTSSSRSGQLLTEILIKGPRFTVPVGETIAGFADVRRLLTRYAHDHGVALQALVKGGTPYEIKEL